MSIMSYSSRPESVASSILAPSTDFCNTVDTTYPEDVTKFYPRHNRYYFSDGNVIFLVEGTLYNIHRYFFHRDSSAFASMFSLPFGGRGEGLTDDEPILLHNIKARDFDLFLSILYPAEFGLYTATTVDEWTAILDLAAKWNFRSIKTLAIKQLAPIASPIHKIVCGRKHQIHEWLGDAYRSVCARSEPLTYEEGMRLGMKDVIKISAIRHDNGSRTKRGPLPSLSNKELQKHFGLDIGLLSPSLDKRYSEANEVGLPVSSVELVPSYEPVSLVSPVPSDEPLPPVPDEPIALFPGHLPTWATLGSSSPLAFSPFDSLTEAISNNVNAAQCEPLVAPSRTKPPLTKAQQKKNKQQEAKEAKADKEYQEQLKRELAELKEEAEAFGRL